MVLSISVLLVIILKEYMRYLYGLIVIFIFHSCVDQNGPKTNLTIEEEKVIQIMAKSYFQPLPEIDWAGFSPEEKHRIELGKKLFYDKKLSFNQTQNCASCHKMENYAMDNLPVSPGDDGQPGVRNVPSILNAALQYAQFWDAREPDVEAQAAGPIFGQKEMGMRDTLELLSRISNDPEYPSLFGLAFPERDSLVSLTNLKTAIAAFERTLFTPSRFDDYLNGDSGALTMEEKRGMKDFIDQGCIPCHSGVLLGGQMAQKFALFGYYWDYTGSEYLDKGRYSVTLNPSEKFVFKVPSLRNVSETKPYFHDGSVDDLEEAIRIMSFSELNHDMEEEQVKRIAVFLKSLTGKVPGYVLENNRLPFE